MDVVNTITVIWIWGAVIALAAHMVHHLLTQRSDISRTPLPPPKISRHVKLRTNGGRHTDQEWIALCATYKNKCARCRKRAVLTKDHVIPVSLGGGDGIDNIQPLCGACNSSKGTKTTDYRSQKEVR